MDKWWLGKKAILFLISLIGIIIAAKIPNDPNNVASDTTTMVAPPATNPFENCVAASAILEAYGDNINIGVPFGGLVAKRFVDIYETVKAGDPLIELDTRDIRAKIDVDKADIKVKEENLNLLEVQLARYMSVTDPRAISEEIITTKKSEIEVAKANLELAKKGLARDEIELSRHLILAPRDGTIMKIDYHVGEFIEARNITEERILLGDLSSLQVRVDVDEQNASRVKAGRQAIGYPRGVLKRPFKLEFMRIEPYVVPKRNLTGNSDEVVDTRVLQVLYKLTPIEGFSVYPGQQFDVYIEADPVVPYDQKASVLTGESLSRD